MNYAPPSLRRFAIGIFVSLSILAACSSSDSQTATPDQPTVPIGTPCSNDTECGGGQCKLGACVPGAKCTDDSQCNGDRCSAGSCVPVACTDGTKNGTETDVDCGGAVCARCPNSKACVAATDCADKICTGNVCVPPSATDGIQNGTEVDVDCGGGAPTNAPKCADGKKCAVAADCVDGVCGGDGKCAAPTSSDAVKNGTETDVDCGGGIPTNAPTCDPGKACLVPGDCFWGHCDGNLCGGHQAGTKDGDETDIDCGGKKSPACDWYKGCAVDGDCTTKACGTDSKCLVGPSCKPTAAGNGGSPSTFHGTSTCGLGEYDDVNNKPGPNHETCCKSLPVASYVDPDHAGKTTYVDKYEITAGRMRTFVNAISAASGGEPNIKAYMAAHRPAVRWNQGWESILPSSNASGQLTYTIKNPTVDLLYPGNDQYKANYPGISNEGGWWIGNVSGPYAAGTSVDSTISTGLYYAFGSYAMFPEYFANDNWKPPAGNGPSYAQDHALDCDNSAGDYGWATYWLPSNIINQYGGGVGKYFSQAVLDEKAMNCTPLAVLAAFCAWDGGQLMTAEVSDAITGNTVEPAYVVGVPNLGGVFANLNLDCGGKTPPTGAHPNGILNIWSDGGSYSCDYGYPGSGPDNNYDGSARIAPPGRFVSDTVAKNAGDEPWIDMLGNLEEAVLKRGETQRFDYRGYGAEYSSIQFHKNQQRTPRFKGGAFGARCMRFK